MSLFKVLDSLRGQKYNFLETVSAFLPVQKKLPKDSDIDFHAAEANYTLAVSLFEHEDYEPAYQYLKDAIKSNYKYAQPYLLISDIYLQAKKNREAQMILKKAIEYTGHVSAYEKLGEIYKSNGFNEKFKNLWYDFIGSSNKKSIGYIKLAEFYTEQRDLMQAVTNYEQALRLNPSNIHIFEKIAEIYEFMGKYNEAIKTYKEFMSSNQSEVFFRNDSNKSKILKQIGNLYFKLRDFDNAIINYKKALDLIFNDSEIYTKFGDICLMTKDYDNAKKNYMISYQLKNDDIEILVKLATLYYIKKDFENSKGFYSQIIKYNPTISNIHAILKSIAEKNPNDEIMSEILDENTDLCIDDLDSNIARSIEQIAPTEEQIKKIDEYNKEIREESSSSKINTSEESNTDNLEDKFLIYPEKTDTQDETIISKEIIYELENQFEKEISPMLKMQISQIEKTLSFMENPEKDMYKSQSDILSQIKDSIQKIKKLHSELISSVPIFEENTENLISSLSKYDNLMDNFITKDSSENFFQNIQNFSYMSSKDLLIKLKLQWELVKLSRLIINNFHK